MIEADDLEAAASRGTARRNVIRRIDEVSRRPLGEVAGGRRLVDSRARADQDSAALGRSGLAGVSEHRIERRAADPKARIDHYVFNVSRQRFAVAKISAS